MTVEQLVSAPESQSAERPHPDRELAIFVKSYAPDARHVARLVASVARFNVDAIPTVLAVPDNEVAEFSSLAGGAATTVVPESSLGAPIVTEKIRGYEVGYIQQQLAKLSIHRLGVARNYFVVDSDSMFIRPFSLADFLDGAGRPFTVLTQDKDQLTDPGYARFAALRAPMVGRIADYLSLPAQPRATSHNNTVLSAAVLESFERWRDERGLSLIDLMEIAPLEYSWYNFYLQRHHPNLVVPIEPLVRMIHTRSEFRSLVRQGVTTESLSRSYIGVCINSGWAGRSQRRVLAKLERGSAAARVRVRVDARRYALHQEIEFFKRARAREADGRHRRP